MNYRLQKEAAAYARQGPNTSWSRWASGFTAPGNVESIGWQALSYLSGGQMNGRASDPYYGGFTGQQASSGGGGGYGMQAAPASQGSQYIYGSATQAATGGRGGGPVQGSGASSASGADAAAGMGGAAIFI